MKIRVIVFFAAAALMLSPGGGANAATVFDTSSCAAFGFFQFGRLGITENVAQSFLTVAPLTAGNVTWDGTFRESGTGANSTFFAEIRLDVMGEPDGVIAISNETFDTTDIAGIGPTDLQFTFSGVTLLDATTYWLVMVDPLPDGGAPDDDFQIKNCDLSGYADGSMARFDGTVWIASNPVQDFFGVLDQDVTFPTNNEIVVPVFFSTLTVLPFDVSGTCDSDLQTDLEVEITEAFLPLNFVDRQFTTCQLDDTWDLGTMGAAAWNADFTISLYEIDTFGTRILPSLDEINVTVDVTGNTNPPPPVIDPAATDDDFGFLGNLIRDALVFLFIPSAESLQRFSNLFELIGTKPPIGFITAAVAAFDSLEVGTPVETLEGTATLSEYFDPIRAAISAFLFLLFGLWLINRLSRISI